MSDILQQLKEDAPYSSDGIYLQKNNKQPIAVCSNDKIASELAKMMSFYLSSSEKDIETINLLKKMIISGYYLLTAIEECKIYVNSLQTQILQHSHDDFYSLLQQFFTLHPEILNNIDVINSSTN